MGTASRYIAPLQYREHPFFACISKGHPPLSTSTIETGTVLAVRQIRLNREYIHNEGPCLTWILHVDSGQYLAVSSNVQNLLGYTPDGFTTGGVEFTNSLIHPADAGSLQQVKQRIGEFLRAIPFHQRSGYRFNYDYRVQTVNGSYIRLLEQSTVLTTNEQGEVTHQLSVCTDITSWKTNELITASVVSPKGDVCLVFTAKDPKLHSENPLSKREKEIVQLVAEGFNSRQIADRLFISLHTVNTHRRNILKKINTKAGSGLIRYALINNR